MLQIAQCSGSRFFAATATRLRNATQKIQIPAVGFNISPYAMFIKENFAKEKSGTKNGSAPEVLKSMSTTWKNMPADQKQVYAQKSSAYRESKIREFSLLSNEEQKQAVEKATETKIARAQRKERKERKELWEKTGHPERPPTGFQLFVKDRFNSLKNSNQPVTPVTSFLKKFSDEWNTASDKEKEKYDAQSRDLREKYKVDVESWKKKVKE